MGDVRWLRVFAEDAEDLALDADVGGGGVDGGHLGLLEGCRRIMAPSR